MATALLRRYTDLPAALALLRNSEITLLPPESWDDRNDRWVMQAYARARGLKTLLALCFSEAAETYHHWKVFAPGSSGICIEFDKERLLGALPTANLRHEKVRYKTIKQIKEPVPHPDGLPFGKRLAFKDEVEYRVIFESKRQLVTSRRVPFPSNAIRRVIVSPWLPDALFDSTAQAIREAAGENKVAVVQSRLIASPSWGEFAAMYA